MDADEAINILKGMLVLCLVLFVIWSIMQTHNITIGSKDFVNSLLRFILSELPSFFMLLLAGGLIYYNHNIKRKVRMKRMEEEAKINVLKGK